VWSAKKVCERLGEHRDWWRSEGPGRTFVFWNRTSVMSYAMARQKSDYLNGYRRERAERSLTEEELRAGMLAGGRRHELVVEGGAWWEHCQEDVAKFKQVTAKQNNAGVDLNTRHQSEERNRS
jgi:hypothetical protein